MRFLALLSFCTIPIAYLEAGFYEDFFTKARTCEKLLREFKLKGKFDKESGVYRKSFRSRDSQRIHHQGFEFIDGELYKMVNPKSPLRADIERRQVLYLLDEEDKTRGYVHYDVDLYDPLDPSREVLTIEFARSATQKPQAATAMQDYLINTRYPHLDTKFSYDYGNKRFLLKISNYAGDRDRQRHLLKRAFPYLAERSFSVTAHFSPAEPPLPDWPFINVHIHPKTEATPSKDPYSAFFPVLDQLYERVEKRRSQRN